MEQLALKLRVKAIKLRWREYHRVIFPDLHSDGLPADAKLVLEIRSAVGSGVHNVTGNTSGCARPESFRKFMRRMHVEQKEYTVLTYQKDSRELVF